MQAAESVSEQPGRLSSSFDQDVVPELSNCHVSQRRQFRNFCAALAGNGRDCVDPADDFRGDEYVHFINQVLVMERAVQTSAGFEQHVGKLTLPQIFQQLLRHRPVRVY